MLPKGFISNPKPVPRATVPPTTSAATASATGVVSVSHSLLPPPPLQAPASLPRQGTGLAGTPPPLPVAAAGTSTGGTEILSDSESESEDDEQLLDEQGGKKQHTRRNETAEERKIRKLKVRGIQRNTFFTVRVSQGIVCIFSTLPYYTLLFSPVRSKRKED